MLTRAQIGALEAVLIKGTGFMEYDRKADHWRHSRHMGGARSRMIETLQAADLLDYQRKITAAGMTALIEAGSPFANEARERLPERQRIEQEREVEDQAARVARREKAAQIEAQRREAIIEGGRAALSQIGPDVHHMTDDEVYDFVMKIIRMENRV